MWISANNPHPVAPLFTTDQKFSCWTNWVFLATSLSKGGAKNFVQVGHLKPRFQVSIDSIIYQQYRIQSLAIRYDINSIISLDIWADTVDISDINDIVRFIA